MRIWSNPSLSGVGGSTASRRSNNILLPAFADAMQQQVGRWEAQIGEGTYTDFSSWRFIQPQ